MDALLTIDGGVAALILGALLGMVVLLAGLGFAFWTARQKIPNK